MYGVWFWYHLLSIIVSIEVALGSFFVASLAEHMAVLASLSL